MHSIFCQAKNTLQKMSTQKKETTKKPAFQQKSADELFEDLIENHQSQAAAIQPQPKPKLKHPTIPLSKPQIQAQQSIQQILSSCNSNPNQRQKSNALSDDLIQGKNLCPACSKCAQLQKSLKSLLSQNKSLQLSLTETTSQLTSLKQTFAMFKQTHIPKTQLNFSVQSLKQMLKCYEQQSVRLQKFLFQTTNTTPCPATTNKSTSQLIEKFITDFMHGWVEVNRELDILLVVSTVKGSNGKVVKKGVQYKFDYYETMGKLDEVKENVGQLQRIVRGMD